jgi:hypothetical protein
MQKTIEGMQRLVWEPKEVRREVQKQGVNVIPANFYSSVPSIDEIETSFEYKEGAPPYLNESIFNAGRLREFLAELIPFAHAFEPPTQGDEKTCADGFFWENGQFTSCDAMAYYAFIRKVKPKHIVEIGSGFSTLVAIEALKANGAGRITCIEPFPRPFLENRGDIELLQVKAQDVTPEQLNSMLEDGDVVFIDSTHTVKTGSDCLHIYLRLLPAIKKNVYVHIHDIFLPFGLPQHWLLDLQIYWTEQYLVAAWLQDNPKTTVLYGSMYHRHFNKGLMDDLMHGRFQTKGASFWIDYRGDL